MWGTVGAGGTRIVIIWPFGQPLMATIPIFTGRVEIGLPVFLPKDVFGIGTGGSGIRKAIWEFQRRSIFSLDIR